VPVYYDLKESTDWEPDFEALELDLTKVKIMWIGYPHMPTEQGSLDYLKS
jgi:aspartate/methionine/tyrosine aminotransferase